MLFFRYFFSTFWNYKKMHLAYPLITENWWPSIQPKIIEIWRKEQWNRPIIFTSRSVEKKHWVIFENKNYWNRKLSKLLNNWKICEIYNSKFLVGCMASSYHLFFFLFFPTSTLVNQNSNKKLLLTVFLGSAYIMYGGSETKN